MKSLFYKPIKIKHPEEDIFISSDLHLHQLCSGWETPLWKMRGYSSVEEHYEGILNNWNSVVKNTSEVFLLGDTIFQSNGDIKLLEFFKRANFHRLYLMRGNHGSGWDAVFKELDDNILQIEEKTVIFCPNYLEAFINGQAVVFSHYFIASWNGMAGGSLHCHGHSHQSLLKGPLADYIKTVRVMDVGIDATGFPFSFKGVRERLCSISPYAPDHHDSNTANPF